MASFSHRGCAWRSDGDLPGVSERDVQLSRRIHAAGNVVLTESLTYPDVKAAAAYTGVRLVGVPMDENGKEPLGRLHGVPNTNINLRASHRALGTKLRSQGLFSIGMRSASTSAPKNTA
jgi:hypothetical protein